MAACHDPSAAQLSTASPVASTASTNAMPPASAPAEGSANAASAPPPAPAPAPSLSAEPGHPGPIASVAAASPDASPPLLDADGKPLPQTDARPSLESPVFQRRIAALANSIRSGDAEPALDAFFPVVAYQQVKDVAKPERDHKFRLIANFKRDIAEYHRALGGADAAAAKFEGVTVPEKDARWMAPGSEGNKLGYFRVLRSRLRFTLPSGRSRDFELTSMISWRGEWYVVHLHGFK